MRSRLLCRSAIIVSIKTGCIIGLLAAAATCWVAAEPSTEVFSLPATQRLGLAPTSFTNLEDAVRAYSELQKESQSVRQLIEQTRQAAQDDAKRQTEAFTLQMDRMRVDIESQRKEKEMILNAVEAANQRSLAYGTALVGVLLAGVMIMSFFQLRATAKLTSLAMSTVSERRQLPQPSVMSFERSLPPPPETGRLLQSLEKLERRLLELEATTRGTRSGLLASEATAAAPAPSLSDAPSSTLTEASNTSLIGGVLGRGESLLQLGNVDEALAAFDEALRLDSRNVDAWVKKGSALEKLDRMEEAVACYDRAIELNRASTLAYLYKGGVCNRLERFDEALACYEQALRSQATA